MEKRKSISVIIPNYNGQTLLEHYLPYTLNSMRNAGVKYEIIIVDDCSTDGSVEFVKQNYPEIQILVNAENKGFSYSCNRGIEHSAMELIFLLNSDIKLTANYF